MQEKKSDVLPSISANPALIGAAYHYRHTDGYFWVGYARNWVRFRAQASDLNALFALLDGSRSLEDYLEEAHAIAPRLSKEQILQMLQALARRGLLMAGRPYLPSSLAADAEYLERHSRDIELYALFEKEDVSRYDYLARLKSSRVVVIGLGGVGSWLSLSLACIGIGELVGVDFDTVELSNLARQILYTPADLGQSKAVASQAFFARFSPKMQFSSHCIRISKPDDVIPLVRNADFVVLAADWPPRRIGRWVNQACVETGVPALYMSISASYVFVGPLVMPGQSSCYECFYRQRQQGAVGFAALENAALSEEWFADPTPALSPLPGLAGHMLSWEMLCALTGIQQPCTFEHILQLDLTTFNTKHYPVAKQPACPVCASFTGGRHA